MVNFVKWNTSSGTGISHIDVGNNERYMIVNKI